MPNTRHANPLEEVRALGPDDARDGAEDISWGPPGVASLLLGLLSHAPQHEEGPVALSGGSLEHPPAHLVETSISKLLSRPCPHLLKILPLRDNALACILKAEGRCRAHRGT